MDHYRVKPDQAVNLHDHDANDTGDYKNKEEAAERTEHLRQKLDALQENLVHALKDMDPQLPKGPDLDWKKLRHDVSET